MDGWTGRRPTAAAVDPRFPFKECATGNESKANEAAARVADPSGKQLDRRDEVRQPTEFRLVERRIEALQDRVALGA